MKKILGILVLGLLLSGNVEAKTKNIANGLSINIPNKYKYFELTFRQLVSRFPEIVSDEQIYDDFGIGMGAKLIVISDNQKTIKFFNDVTSVTGLEKLNRKHVQPLMQKLQDQKFLDKMMKIIQKEEPNADFENMTEEEMVQLMEKISENPKMIKAFERLFKPNFKKFFAEYDLDKYTILLIGDKNAEYLEEIKDLVVCPTCLGEKPLKLTVSQRIDEEEFHFCRCPHCLNEFNKNPQYYIQRLSGMVDYAGIFGENSCCTK